ncbi:hypothetical protein [Kordiimonas pumila]|uniref:HEPN AbiU2-like domain-containing protein n=1 Tax=Kordiimonas pumila TaxID=2161677 RepID=A0ABV7D180_9PROT|nr:hypothetical protein [Kordiimonas pumila]
MEKGNRPWSDAELTASIHAYFYLLHSQIKQIEIDRNEFINGVLSGSLSTRNDASLRYRLRNISHVFQLRGMQTVSYYSPAPQVGSGVIARIHEILDRYPTEFLNQFRAPATNQINNKTKGHLIKALEHLDDALADVKGQYGRGHNNPPELILDHDIPAEVIQEIDQISAAVKEELIKPNLDKKKLKTVEENMLSARSRVWDWLLGRLTKFIDAALVTAAPLVLAKVFNLYGSLTEALGILSRFLGG